MNQIENGGVMHASGPWRWTSYALDTFLAPNLSGLTSVEIPDRSELSAQARMWVSSFHLRAMLVAQVSPEYLRTLFLFVRRSAAAVRCYESARVATEEFVAKHSDTQPGVHRYTIAADQWEIFISYAEQAADLLDRVEHTDPQRFKKGERSVHERLHGLHADAKHAIGRMRNDPSHAEAAFPVWLESQGLRSKNYHLTWSEAVEIVDGFADFIQMLEQATRNRRDSR